MWRPTEHAAEFARLSFVLLTAEFVCACGGGSTSTDSPSSDTSPSTSTSNFIYLNHDLSTGNLSQWTNFNYGLGTDTGSNDSGAGYLWYHANVGGSRAAGMTATPTAQASPAPNSDSVYLWDPTQYWNYAPYEIWLRTSVMFPSASTISTAGAEGEQPYQPTTGMFNWFLEFHNDGNPEPSCAQEVANISMDVTTDDPIQSGVVGTKNVRLAARITGGNDCAGPGWASPPARMPCGWHCGCPSLPWAAHPSGAGRKSNTCAPSKRRRLSLA